MMNEAETLRPGDGPVPFGGGEEAVPDFGGVHGSVSVAPISYSMERQDTRAVAKLQEAKRADMPQAMARTCRSVSHWVSIG